MARPIRVGMIGTGFGRKVQGPGFVKHPEFDLVAVASARRAHAEEAAQELGATYATDDWERMLEEVEMDLVSVVTPPVFHHRMARRALERGRDLLLEKPTAMNVAEVEDLLALATSRKCMHALNHEFRWTPARAQARELVRSGEIGTLLRYNVHSFSSFFNRHTGIPRRWLCDASMGGGLLGALGSHLIDSAIHVAGPIDSVSARLETQVKGRPDELGRERACTADDGFTVLLDFDSGGSGILECSAVLSHAWTSYSLHGERGSLFIEKDQLYRTSADRHHEPVPPDERFAIASLGADARLDPFYAFLSALAPCLRARTEFRPNLVDGLAVQRVLDAARASSRSGQRESVLAPQPR